jgi:hypothetical protein
MLPVWYYWSQRKVRLGDSQVGLRHAVDHIGEPGLPIEIIEFGAAERGMENGEMDSERGTAGAAS